MRRIKDFFLKDVLFNIIHDNLEILRRCIGGTIYQQWTAVILLMQFIEYLLKYKIQSGEGFETIHEIKRLYDDLTDDDREDIEERISKLMKDREVKREPKSFDSIQEFARRYNKAYLRSWRYDILGTDFESDEEAFYLADTITLLRALIESTDLEIDLPSIINEDELAQKIVKDGVRGRWVYLP